MPGLNRDNQTATTNSFTQNGYQFSTTRLNPKALIFRKISEPMTPICPLHKNAFLKIIQQVHENNNNDFSENSFYMNVEIRFLPTMIRFEQSVYINNGQALLATLNMPKMYFRSDQFFDFINGL